MMQLPYRLIWGQLGLGRHKSKLGTQHHLHRSTVAQPPTVPSPPPVPPSQGKEVKEIQIPVPWGHISGRWWGQTDVRPVLLIHGWQDNAGSFDTLAPLLKIGPLLAVEMVGHGQSSHYPLGQCYAFPDGTNTLRRIVRHFGWEHDTISLVAHSLGSAMAFFYAGAFPENVDRLVCLDCSRSLLQTMGEAAAGMRAAIETSLAHERRTVATRPWYTMDEAVDMYRLGFGGSATREASRAIIIRGTIPCPDDPTRLGFTRDSRLRSLAPSAGLSREGVFATASRISCRVLDIRASDSFTGQPDVMRFYERTMEIVRTNAKQHEYRVVEGTHHVHLNAPERVAPIVNEFFRTRDEDRIY